MIVSSLFSATINKPTKHFIADGQVTDMIYEDAKLYVSTSAGVIDIFDETNQKIISKIRVPKIKDFMGDDIDAKIYSVDILDDVILVLSQAKSSYRDVWIYKNSKLIKIIDSSEKLSIAKAKFLDKDNIILALLSNDIISYNISKSKQNWTTQASESKFSDFDLSDDKSKVVVADESGDLQIIDTKNAKRLKTLSGENLDNVFKVVYTHNIISTAGQDRRNVVYDLTFNSSYYKSSNFLVYGVGLSPKVKLVAYSCDENNNVEVYKRSTKSIVGIYGGNKMTITTIVFKNEKEFFVASDDKVINFYKIK